MRTADLLERTGRTASAGGGRATPRGLHLGGALRAADHSADLAASWALGSGTLDGTITCIQAGEHGVLVRHRAGRLRLVAGAP